MLSSLWKKPSSSTRVPKMQENLKVHATHPSSDAKCTRSRNLGRMEGEKEREETEPERQEGGKAAGDIRNVR